MYDCSFYFLKTDHKSTLKIIFVCVWLSDLLVKVNFTHTYFLSGPVTIELIANGTIFLNITPKQIS